MPSSPNVPPNSALVPSTASPKYSNPAITAGVAEQPAPVHTLVKPLPVVPLADVAILTPPYSAIVPAFPTYIVTVGKPDPLAFADTATTYRSEEAGSVKE